MGSHGPEWQTAVARGQSAFDRVRVTRPAPEKLDDFGGVGIDDKREARLSEALSAVEFRVLRMSGLAPQQSSRMAGVSCIR